VYKEIAMKDLINASILLAQRKGKIGRIDLIIRYLRIKHQININPTALIRRILHVKLHKPYGT
jgi:hypothetical protein